jgi:hypothetical protein
VNVCDERIGICVMMAKVRIHSPVLGSFQFSQRPAIPNGEPSFIAIAKGCFAFCPLIAFHSKKPSTGTMQRRFIRATTPLASLP